MTGTIKNRQSIDDDGDKRSTMPRFQGDNLEKNLRLIEELGQIADKLGITQGQIALAWLLAQGDYIAPIPGTKRVIYLEENAAAADVELDDKTLASLNTIFATDNISGERYNAAGMKSLDRD